MNKAVKGFLDRLDKVKDRFQWGIDNDSHFRQIIGTQEGGDKFCPMSAVLYSETGKYVKPEQFMRVGLELRLLPREIYTIVDSCDGHGDKYDGYVRYVMYRSLFGGNEAKPPKVAFNNKEL